jgi:hypothetical protein
MRINSSKKIRRRLKTKTTTRKSNRSRNRNPSLTRRKTTIKTKAKISPNQKTVKAKMRRQSQNRAEFPNNGWRVCSKRLTTKSGKSRIRSAKKGRKRHRCRQIKIGNEAGLIQFICKENSTN